MDDKIPLGKIRQRFNEKQVAKVDGYNAFGYIREANNAVQVSRECGDDTVVPFDKILAAIEAGKVNSSLYDLGPSTLSEVGITHAVSPVWTLLHLLSKED